MTSNYSKLLYMFLSLLFLFGCSLPEGKPQHYEKYSKAAAGMERHINLKHIMRDVDHLARAIGPRPAGSVKANAAADWFKERLLELGCFPQTHVFELPDGREGQNILCRIEGRTPKVIVIAAHLDTVEASPGANDDASGLALIIELARLIKQYKLQSQNTILLAAFGAEEEIDGFSGHTYSSLNYLESLPPEARREIVGCIYLDKLGVGQKLLIRNTIFTDSQMAGFCLGLAKKISQLGSNPPIKYGWLLSLPHSFEKYDIPTAWIEWAPDPYMHKSDDLPENIVEKKIMLVARIILHVLPNKF